MKPKRPKKNIFHPLELAICGLSNSGKTTLIEKLITKLSNQFEIGYIKHDAHKFSMDHPGKDTHKMQVAGAKNVFISDPNHHAFIANDQFDYFRSKQIFLDCDFVLIEGYKKSHIPKAIFLDEQFEIFKHMDLDSAESPLFCVGPWESKPNHESLQHLNLPYFHRNDIDAISHFITQYFLEKVTKIPVYGLILAGGQSSRMKQDKAVLEYHGKSQMLHTYETLNPLVEECYFSAREMQRDLEAYQQANVIFDKYIDQGPMGGILSAMDKHPHAAWLVVACDLPHLNQKTIQTLVEERDPLKLGTCYISSTDQLPEPLCAIYEPKSRQRLFEALGLQLKCPRKILINSQVKSLQLEDRQALVNANYPEEYQTIKQQLSNHEARI